MIEKFFGLKTLSYSRRFHQVTSSSNNTESRKILNEKNEKSPSVGRREEL
jgi:hypothetical protein